MPKAARLGDSCAGHGCFPATPIIAGSGDVSINGMPAARKGDAVLLHACPCPNVPHGVHGRSISAGSSNVSINGKPASRVGDAIGCGGSVSAGSGDVFIGDTPYNSPAHDCGEGSAQKKSSFLQILPLVEPTKAIWTCPPYIEEAFIEAAKDGALEVKSKNKEVIPSDKLNDFRKLVEQGIPARAAIKHVKKERITPRDFGVKSIADNAELNKLWSESVQDISNRVGAKKLQERYKKVLAGTADGKEARYVFNEVREVFIDKVKVAESNGTVFDGYQFEQIHHWNWPISKYNSQAIDPKNLFPTTESMHANIHNMTTSGEKKFIPFSYFHPIDKRHVRV